MLSWPVEGGAWRVGEVYSLGLSLQSLLTLVHFFTDLAAEVALSGQAAAGLATQQQPSVVLVLVVGCFSVYRSGAGARGLSHGALREGSRCSQGCAATSHVYAAAIDMALRWHVLQGVTDCPLAPVTEAATNILESPASYKPGIVQITQENTSFPPA
uniref:Uncharacterized protein n=1 Tax=Molossus molossus TaxID=27622 RepID=A0A7J8DBT4_MOLMO|nr:hypothetical protein HJG59_009324 [Molossus molossus]